MASQKHFRWLIVLIWVAMSAVSAQPILEWDARYNGPGNWSDLALAITVDAFGNVYVTGASVGNSTWPDYATIKYDMNGDTLWVRRYSETATSFDLGNDLIVDESGNVYVTGGSVTLKYDLNGTLLWVAQNNGQCFRILLDDAGNVYAAGAGFGDYLINKFDTDGNLIWRRIYNGPANDYDDGYDMVFDPWGNVVVTGRSWGIGTQWDYATIKYSPDGDSLWVRRYNGPGPPSESTDMAFAVAVDDSGNVYVTGMSRGSQGGRVDCLTLKYSPDGDLLWERRYPGFGSIGYGGDDILFDGDGNIYVAARADGYNDTLLKYNRNGNLLWTAVNPANHGFATNPPRLALDSFGNIYMTTHKDSIPTGSTFAVIKYSPAGNEIWEAAYFGLGGPVNANNAYDLHVDSNGNVYLTGESYTPGGQWFDYATVKYSQVTGIGPVSDKITGGFQLYQNYPNPFNPSTTIAYDLPHSGFVTLKVFNLLGQEVATLVNEHKSAGYYQVAFDAKGLASGVYLYRLQAGSFTQTQKMLLLR